MLFRFRQEEVRGIVGAPPHLPERVRAGRDYLMQTPASVAPEVVALAQISTAALF